VWFEINTQLESLKTGVQTISYLYFSHQSGLRPEELAPDEEVDQLPRLLKIIKVFMRFLNFRFHSDGSRVEGEEDLKF
jgi:hypothetical protein